MTSSIWLKANWNMKIRWMKIEYKKTCILFMMIVCMAVLSTMQIFASSPSATVAATGITGLTYDESVATPVVDEAITNYVRSYQMSRAKSLVKAGYEVEMMRSREVIVVILPAAQLFNMTGSEITGKGARKLASLVGYLGDPGFYRIVVAGYTDNTGSAEYCLEHSGKRAVAVADWLRSKMDGAEILDFGMGNESPLLPNNTFANRAVNRRVEVLLVPGDGLISQAWK